MRIWRPTEFEALGDHLGLPNGQATLGSNPELPCWLTPMKDCCPDMEIPLGKSVLEKHILGQVDDPLFPSRKKSLQMSLYKLL